jgi:selenocysteine-specific translation elongation factor
MLSWLWIKKKSFKGIFKVGFIDVMGYRDMVKAMFEAVVKLMC